MGDMFYDWPADFKSYLPEIFQDVTEINELDNVINIQVDALSAQIKQAVNNRYVSTCDETGAARWEKILGVSAPLNSSLQARRDALKAKLMNKPPINLNALKSIIEAYMGLTVGITIDTYTIKIKYRGVSRVTDLKPLYATAYEMIPANMLLDIVYQYMTWGEVKTAYPTWGDVKAKTWDAIRKGV